MKKSVLRKKIILSCLFFILFFCGTGAVVSSSESVRGKITYANLFADEVKEEKESKITSEKFFDKKSLFESEESDVFEKDDDILNAPPDLGEGTFPPGGQVNPDLPLGDAYPVLFLLVFLYGCYRLFIFFGKKEVR